MKQIYTMISPDEYMRLECLKLAVEYRKDPRSVVQSLQDFADSLLRYVKTGNMVIEPTPPPRYRMEEVASGEA
jgi:hypothetical protein